MRIGIATAVVAAGLLVGACADTLAPGAVPLTTASGITTDTDVSAAPPQKETFDPFKRAGETATGGREIIEKPTLAEVLKAGPLPEITVGRADAPVTIVKYMSLTCPYCRKFQLETYPQLKRELIDTGKVRLILREFPIGFQSGLATIALRCAAPDKQMALYEKFLAQQGVWVSQDVRPDPIAKIAAQVGVTREQFDACRQDQALIAGLKWVKDRGRTLGIIGTPNFFINERRIKSVLTMAEIREIVEPLAAGRVAGATGGPVR